MTWRLGVWRNERPLSKLNELLRQAATLPNWASEGALLGSAEYADFWSLVWQLQVAEYLRSISTNVRWCGTGPDLSIRVGNETLFVECYCFRKSFGTRAFLEEILATFGADIKLHHDWFMPFSLPADGTATEFLDNALAPFLDEARIERLRADACNRYPAVVSRPASTLVLYISGPDPSAYVPSILPRRKGNPEEYISVILREAISAKAGSNRLDAHRPNLVAVNYLLSIDAAAAFTLRQIPEVIDLGPNIDALALSQVGIDLGLSREDLVLVQEGTTSGSLASRIARSLS
jgi:hypothetical protein